MFTLEAPTRYRCQCCDSVLQTAPEYECSEWFLRCVSCGAKNLFILTLRFIGWRPAEPDLGHLKACSLSTEITAKLPSSGLGRLTSRAGLGQCLKQRHHAGGSYLLASNDFNHIEFLHGTP